jgi:Zn-dependent protease
MSWWAHSVFEYRGAVALIAWIFWVLVSITLHELAHGWAALWQGDRTPVEQDRMTLNPLVHMGPQSLLLFAICGIAWGMMPVNPHRFRDGRRGDVYVSAAGPAMNLALAALCVALQAVWLKVVPADSPAYGGGATFLFYGTYLNLFLAPFNLMPIPPLDGAHILAGLSRRVHEIYSQPQAQMIGLFLFIAIFFLSPVGGLLWDAVRWTTHGVTDGVGGLVGNPPIGHVMLADRMDISVEALQEILANPPSDGLD